MALSIDQLVKADTQHSDDDWRAWNRMETLAKGEPEDAMARLLWQAQREGKIDLSRFRNGWHELNKWTGYSADDLLHLMKSIEVRFQNASYPPWSPDNDVPGWPQNFHHLLSVKTDDAGFFATLAKTWTTLPGPYDRALALRLAQHGALSHTQLPDGMIDEVAAIYLRTGTLGYEPFSGSVWPERDWNAAVIKAGTSKHFSGAIKEYRTIEHLIRVATPDQFATLISLLPRTTDHEFKAAAGVAAHAKHLIDPLRNAVIALDVHNTTQPEWRDPAPKFNLILAYLSACQKTKTVPDPQCDEQFESFIQHYEARWSGGRFEEYHQRMRDLIAVIPRDRLEPMLLGGSEINFLLDGSCPTQNVAKRVVERIQNTLKEQQAYEFDSHYAIGLASLGEVAIPAMIEAIESGVKNRRQSFVSFLARHPKDARAAKTLATCLSDKSNPIRQLATTALEQGEPDVVLPLVRDAINARAKATREAAASVLAALPPSKARFEIASERLATEKTDSVIALLKLVEPVVEESSSRPTKEIETATETMLADPSTWETFRHLGDDLLHAYRPVLTQAVNETGFYDWSQPRRIWMELLKELGSDAALDLAVEVGACLRSSDYKKYFQALNEIFGKHAVGEVFAQRVATSRFITPHGFNKPRGSSPERDGAEYLFIYYEADAVVAALPMLEHKTVSVRNAASSFILRRRQSFEIKDIVERLRAKRKDVRCVAAELLGELGDPSAITELESAKKKEKAQNVVRVMAESIVKLGNRTFKVGAFDRTADGDKKLDHALAALPTTIPSSVADAMGTFPHPAWQHAEEPMTTAALGWLISELSRESMQQRSNKLQAVCRRLDADDLHRLCEALIAHVGYDDRGWILFMQGAIGSPARIEETGRKLDTFASSKSWDWGDHGVEVMVRRNTLQAARILDDWHHKTRRDALKSRSQDGVRRIAKQHGISVEELLEASISSFGFDDNGEQSFDYGGRTIVVKLEVGENLSFHDRAANKSFKSMPKATKSDDSALVEAARSDVSRLKKELKRLRRNVTRRLETSMVNGRRWVPSDWESRYVQHPVLRSFALGTVWAIFDNTSDAFIAAFHVDDSNELVDVDDNVHALNDQEHRIGVLHPALLSPADRQRWVKLFIDFERLSSLDQLERTVYSPKDIEASSVAIIKSLTSVDGGTFMGRADRLGWERGPREGAGMINSSDKSFGPWRVVMSHDGYAPEYHPDTMYVTDLDIRHEGKKVDASELPTHVFSELIHDLVYVTDSKI